MDVFRRYPDGTRGEFVGAGPMRGIEWLTSPWDGRTHAFQQRGEIASEAICTHSALTTRLTAPANGATRCLAYLLVHGHELADQHGQAARWAP